MTKMAEDIFHGLSPAELKREVAQLIESDTRSLLPKAKVFAAIARIQKFDALPEAVSPKDIAVLLKNNAGVELNRGIAATKGAPAAMYARDLLEGPMYPGSWTAYGHGIYFATPGKQGEYSHFPVISEVALKHAKEGGEGPGAIVRSILKADARTLEIDELYELYRDNKNRAKSAGIEDLGSFAAALGIDAYYRDGAYDHTDERVWIVVNRSALIFQNRGLKIAVV